MLLYLTWSFFLSSFYLSLIRLYLLLSSFCPEPFCDTYLIALTAGDWGVWFLNFMSEGGFPRHFEVLANRRSALLRGMLVEWGTNRLIDALKMTWERSSTWNEFKGLVVSFVKMIKVIGLCKFNFAKPTWTATWVTYFSNLFFWFKLFNNVPNSFLAYHWHQQYCFPITICCEIFFATCKLNTSVWWRVGEGQ